MQARQCCQLRTHTQSRRTSHLAKSVFLLALDLLRRVHPVPLQLELVFQGLHFDRCYDQFQRNFRDLRYIPSCQQRADSPKPTATAPKTGVTARRTAFKGLLSLFAKNNGRCSNSYYCYCHCYLPSYYCYYYYTHIHTKTPVVAPTTTGTTESFHTHAPCRKST